MKKLLILLLGVLLLLSLGACDDLPLPTETEGESPAVSDTAADTLSPEDTRPAETQDTPATSPEAEAGTDSSAPSDDVDAETEASAPADSLLSPEEAEALLADILSGALTEVDAPLSVTMDGRVELTLSVGGLSSVTDLPMGGYWITDGQEAFAFSLELPTMGEVSCILVDRVLYGSDGKTFFKCPIPEDPYEDFTMPEDFEDFLDEDFTWPEDFEEFTWPEDFEEFTWPEDLEDLLDEDFTWPEDFEDFLDEDFTVPALPEYPEEPDGELLLPELSFTDWFACLTAKRDEATGRVTLTLSGLSEEAKAFLSESLDELDKTISAMEKIEAHRSPASPKAYSRDHGHGLGVGLGGKLGYGFLMGGFHGEGFGEGLGKGFGEGFFCPTYGEEEQVSLSSLYSLRALLTAVLEQADGLFTVTLVADAEARLLSVTVDLALEVVESVTDTRTDLAVSLTVTFDNTPAPIEGPENPEDYEEVSFSDLADLLLGDLVPEDPELPAA